MDEVLLLPLHWLSDASIGTKELKIQKQQLLPTIAPL